MKEIKPEELEPEPLFAVLIHRVPGQGMVALCEGSPMAGELADILEILECLVMDIRGRAEQEAGEVPLHRSS